MNRARPFRSLFVAAALLSTPVLASPPSANPFICRRPSGVAGTFKEFPLSTEESGPTGITVGPDGNLWFTQSGSGTIGRATRDGVVTEFPLPSEYSLPRRHRPVMSPP
ncbi:hypothetical protein LY474_15290 [Myxococcus stipitatus]|uniref:virginiamycin B lyase family protein n=1 Tax=Myxococcus stipitatus TaxID=83455 RepID=UPI001F3CE3E9|nr:hypothetical protein [Myxococcus stipitatus]MCE9669176.1 hypothetical protein [Myxococcus stipitatus]